MGGGESENTSSTEDFEDRGGSGGASFRGDLTSSSEELDAADARRGGVGFTATGRPLKINESRSGTTPESLSDEGV